MSPCDEVIAHRVEGAALPASLAQHAERCERCAPLLSVDASLERAASHGADIEPNAALLALMSGPVAPTPRRSLVRSIAPVLAACAAFVALGMLRVRDDFHEQITSSIAPIALLCALGCGAALLLAAGRGSVGLGYRASQRAALVAAMFVAFEGVAWLTQRPTHSSHPLTGSALLNAHVACAAGGLLFAAIVLAVSLVALRKSVVQAAGSAGAALGLAAGCAAALTLELQCAVAEPSHVALSHVAPLIVGAAVGALLGRRALSA